jgi:hypothetical protein
MEDRVVVELPVEGLFSPLGWMFRRFGPLYAPEVDVGFGLTEALQDIRDACVAGNLPELDLAALDVMVEDMHVPARNRRAGSAEGQLSECDLMVILLYTSEFPSADSLYAVVNKKLNIPNRNHVKPFVKYIWLLLRALAKCPSSQYRTVYRGSKNVDLTIHYPDNHEFEWHQFASCSCSLEVQKEFTGQEGVHTVFIVQLTSNRGRDISAYCAVQREPEVLLPPTTKFRVKSKFVSSDGLNMIEVVEIPSSGSVVMFIDGLVETSLRSSPVQFVNGGRSLEPSALPTVCDLASASSTDDSLVTATGPTVVSLDEQLFVSRAGGATSTILAASYQGSSLEHSIFPVVTTRSVDMVMRQPFNNGSLKEAVKLWCENKVAAVAKYGDISTWDTSQVTSMKHLFNDCKSFNDRIGSWDVSHVTDMLGMFGNATCFNQSLESWNVSEVTSMYGMFFYASSFNQPLNLWNVSNVIDLSFMFAGARAFNQPLHSWDVGSVKTMESMFYLAEAFNQPLQSWNVESVTNMNCMFDGALSFNHSLDTWNVVNVLNMNNMFDGAAAFDQSLIRSWVYHRDVTKVNMLSGTKEASCRIS